MHHLANLTHFASPEKGIPANQQVTNDASHAFDASPVVRYANLLVLSSVEYQPLSMKLADLFIALGEEGFRELIRTISIGKLRTYQMYERLKTRAHLPKLNVEGLRKATPRFWSRLSEPDDEFASDLSQAILVSNLNMVIEILDFLGVPHTEGFFEKDLDAGSILTEGWQQRAYNEFKEKYPKPLVLFYLNHLALEVMKAEQPFTPTETANG
jgi:hypothetical protein